MTKEQIESDFLHVLQDFIYRPDYHAIAPNPVGVDREFLNFLYALIDLRINSTKKVNNLKSLKEFNSERYKHHESYSNIPRPNGIACPKCNLELLDSDPSTQLASNPPQKNIHCPSCDYVGYRIA